MNWISRAMITGVSGMAIAIIVTTCPNAVLGEKAGSAKDKGKDHDAVHHYHHALEIALKKLKEAEKHLLEADVKELNLAQNHPDVVQKLTQAVQLVNQGYAIAEACKQTTPTPPKSKEKAKPKGK
jgi:hypothetical protein